MPGADKFIKPLSGVVMLFDRERFIGKWQKPNFYRSLWLIDLCFFIQQNIPKGITGNNSRIPVNSSSRDFIGKAGDFQVIELIHNRSNSIALTWFYPYFLSTMSRTLQCFSLRLWNKLRHNRRILIAFCQLTFQPNSYSYLDNALNVIFQCDICNVFF